MLVTPHWDREPTQALGGLDAVAIPPVVLRILEVVVEYEKIGVMDYVEVALPRKVVGLNDGDAPTGRTWRASRDLRAVSHIGRELMRRIARTSPAAWPREPDKSVGKLC